MSAARTRQDPRMAEEFDWRGRRVRWERRGSGPPVVLCHGTPWSSRLWAPHRGRAQRRLHGLPVGHAGLRRVVEGRRSSASRSTSRASCCTTCSSTGSWTRRTWSPTTTAARWRCGRTCCTAPGIASLALVDVVALAPVGIGLLPARARARGGLHGRPARDPRGHRARLHRRREPHRPHRGRSRTCSSRPGSARPARRPSTARSPRPTSAYTDEIEPLYPTLDLPVLVVWGTEDTWIPVDRAHRLAEPDPGRETRTSIENAGHLIQLDQPGRAGEGPPRMATIDPLSRRGSSVGRAHD